jgi:crossover junction endodeoxyribonuclease RuvC
MRAQAIRIIGIDPGLRRTGWGIVEADGVRLVYVASGLITSNAEDDLAYRLRELYEGLVRRHRQLPAAGGRRRGDLRQQGCARHAEARPGARHGAAGPRAEGPARCRIPAQRVKKTVTGTGHGEKRQIAAMIGFLLPKSQVRKRG